MSKEMSVYSLEDKFKMVRDIPKVSKLNSNKTIESICEDEYQITRQAFYKYRRQIGKILRKHGYTLKDLHTFSNMDIKNILNKEQDETQQNLNKTVDEELKEVNEKNKNVLKNMYDDLNETVQEVKEVKIENENEEIKQNDEIDIEERESKKNILKWGLIVGGIVIVSVSLLIFYKSKNKSTTKTKNNTTQTETKPKNLNQTFWQEKTYTVEEY